MSTGERLAKLEQQMSHQESATKGHEVRINDHDARINTIEGNKHSILGGFAVLLFCSAAMMWMMGRVVVSEVQAMEQRVTDQVIKMKKVP